MSKNEFVVTILTSKGYGKHNDQWISRFMAMTDIRYGRFHGVPILVGHISSDRLEIVGKGVNVAL